MGVNFFIYSYIFIIIANDMIENSQGMSPYDGIGDD